MFRLTNPNEVVRNGSVGREGKGGGVGNGSSSVVMSNACGVAGSAPSPHADRACPRILGLLGNGSSMVY